MRVTSSIADMQITVDRIIVEDQVLVMTNGSEDAMPMRAVMSPRDVRKIFGSMLRPSVFLYLLSCIFRNDIVEARDINGSGENHPTPNPW